MLRPETRQENGRKAEKLQGDFDGGIYRRQTSSQENAGPGRGHLPDRLGEGFVWLLSHNEQVYLTLQLDVRTFITKLNLFKILSYESYETVAAV